MIWDIKYNIGNKVKYEKSIFGDINGYYQKVNTVIKEGYIIGIEIDFLKNICYKVGKTKSPLNGWEWVQLNKVIKEIKQGVCYG